MLGILVPEMERAIAPSSAESTVYGMEGNRIDGVDIANVTVVGGRFTMALETEIGGGVLFFHILNGTSTFDTADRKATGIGKAADHPRLPLQWGLKGLVECRGIVEVDDVNVTVGSANHEEFVLDIHGIDALLTFEGRNRSRLSQIPIFDSLVP